MAALANSALADVWLTVAEAVDLGAVRRTVYWLISEDRMPQREGRHGVEVPLVALPHHVQVQYVERRLPKRVERCDEIELELDGPLARQRLGRFAPEVAAAVKAEVARRHELLREYAALKPKTIDWLGARIPAPAVDPILRAWPARDPVVVRARPLWAEPCCQRTLDRSLAAVREHGAAVLVPAAPVVKNAHDDGRCRPIDKDVAAEIFRLRLVAYRNATVVSLHRKLVDYFGVRAPSLSGLKRYLKREIPASIDVLMRKGKKTYRATAQPPILRDWSALDVGQMLCGDHHQFDLQVINPARGGQLDRPWVTLWQDLRTRAPQGWCVSFAPNSETIKTALLHAMRPKEHPVFAQLWGKPDELLYDNGKDYRARNLEGAAAFDEARAEGLYANLGIEVHHALPYNAKAKPVERFFLTVVEQFSRDFGDDYCGRNTVERTERHRDAVKQHDEWLQKKRGTTPFMTMAEFQRRWDAWVIEYLQRPHSALFEEETGREMSPVDEAAKRARAPRLINEELLRFVAKRRVTRTVQKATIYIDSYAYRADELLRLPRGAKVECWLDPSDLRYLDVCARNGDFICRAVSVDVVQMTGGRALTEQAQRAIEAQRRGDKRAIAAARAVRDRELDGITAADLVLAQPTPPAPPSTPAAAAPAPADAVIAIHPRIEHIARAAARAKTPAPPDRAAPAFAAAPAELDDEAYVREQIGDPEPEPRPTEPADDRAWKLKLRAEWFAMRDEVLARRCQKKTAQGGAPQ